MCRSVCIHCARKTSPPFLKHPQNLQNPQNPGFAGFEGSWEEEEMFGNGEGEAEIAAGASRMAGAFIPGTHAGMAAFWTAAQGGISVVSRGE